jgi:D-threonate/D-erythronate kinase
VPLAETDFARDPRWPATTSSVPELVGLPCTHLSLSVVRRGAKRLAHAISMAPTRVVSTDAVEDRDLQLIGEAAVLDGALPCGALGLAKAWAAALLGEWPSAEARLSSPANGPMLLIAGSHHPATAAQVTELGRARDVVEVVIGGAGDPPLAQARGALISGRSVVVRAPSERLGAGDAWDRVRTGLAEVARMACRDGLIGAIIVAGGETTREICLALGAAAIRLRGEILPGVPWGVIDGGGAHGLTLVTKAGGFGEPDAFLRTYDMLCEGSEQ